MDEQIPLIERFATYGAGLKYEDIPRDAVRSAKWLVFDSLGAGLGGYRSPLGRKVAEFSVRQMPSDLSAVLGDGRRSTPEGAAFANATMIKILGMDESHRMAGHIAAQVMTAALAVGEANHIGGRDLIVSMVAAYDLAVRVGRAVRHPQGKRGLDLKGTVGTMAAALAAGLCAGLNADRLSHAMALAADMSSGTEQYVYEQGQCETKDLISGFAARSGVFAARLAECGFYGSRGALDGEYGFFRAFGDGFDPAVFAGLGEGFAISSSAFRPHAGCRRAHHAVDAVQEVLKQVELNPSSVEKVVVGTYRWATQPTFRVDPNPACRQLAGYSIQTATAVALVRHNTWPDDLDHWDDPQVRRLRHLIEVEVDPEIEGNYPNANGCRVLVTLNDGRTFEGYVEYAKGEPENPMTDAELQEKFEVLAGPILPKGRVGEVFSACMHLEQEEDVGALLALCTGR
ncbi:MmgE/PrpD family protein [Chloroflexota bacterium]